MQTLTCSTKDYMRSVNVTMGKRLSVFVLLSGLFCYKGFGQNTNSPYSRYGIGDLLSSQNIVNRGMGGLSTAYADFQSLNFFNPASYGQLQSVTYDFGLELDNLSIQSNNPVKKFSNSSPIMSYVNLGIPLKKGGGWAVVFGLRPVSRIRYKIDENISTLFEGNGGSQQVYLGTGFKIGNLTAGVNAGYLFGSKDYSTRRIFLNDTVNYYKSNHESKSSFHGFIASGGLQYKASISQNLTLRLGLQGSLQQKIQASRDIIRQTYSYDANSATYQIDSIYGLKGQSGSITMPGSYSAGLVLDRNGRWQVGIDYTTSQWNEYLFFGEQDQVGNSTQFHVGGQLVPVGGKSYWSNVAYRAGLTWGKDYVRVNGTLPKLVIALGAGLPMRRVTYTNQFSVINLSVEFGQRGNQNSLVKENFFRLALGLSMSDIWFIKRKYD